MKITHISVTARDAKRLAQFYMDGLGLRERRPPKRLVGDVVSRGNGLPASDIYSVWLEFATGSKRFLEIMEYRDTETGRAKPINETGFAHIALEVADLHATLERIMRCGGSQQGEVVNLGSAERPCRCVYVRDPEGNVLELESRTV